MKMKRTDPNYMKVYYSYYKLMGRKTPLRQLPDGTRLCRRCGKYFEASKFGSDKSKESGLSSSCRQCVREKRAEYYARVKDTSEFKQRNAISEKKNAHKHIEKKRAYDRQWKLNNAERLRELARKRYHANPERARAKSRRNAQTPKGRLSNRIRCSNYYIRVKWNGGKIKPADWQAIVERQQGRCLACGEVKKLTMDHIVPLSKGGKHDPSNIQGLCKPCNSKKGTRTIAYA